MTSPQIDKEDIQIPYQVVPFSLGPGEQQTHRFSEARNFWIYDGSANLNGNLYLSIGATGSEFQAARGLFLQTSGFRRLNIRNNSGAVTIKGHLLITADPAFQPVYIEFGLVAP